VEALALCLPACVFEEPALGPSDEALIKSTYESRPETGITEMGDPPSNLGTWDTKLPKACNEYEMHK
jgi:hypothetical protein